MTACFITGAISSSRRKIRFSLPLRTPICSPVDVVDHRVARRGLLRQRAWARRRRRPSSSRTRSRRRPAARGRSAARTGAACGSAAGGAAAWACAACACVRPERDDGGAVPGAIRLAGRRIGCAFAIAHTVGGGPAPSFPRPKGLSHPVIGTGDQPREEASIGPDGRSRLGGGRSEPQRGRDRSRPARWRRASARAGRCASSSASTRLRAISHSGTRSSSRSCASSRTPATPSC